MPWEPTIQTIFESPGGIKPDLVSGQPLPVPAGADRCPFCHEAHRLHRHGCYWRFAVTEHAAHLIPILRLLCARTGRTVSLLPDFLVPRKQHTASVIATFLHAFAWLGLHLAAAVTAATQMNPVRQKGAFWCRAVIRHARVIRAYCATLAPRVAATLPPAPAHDSRTRRLLRSLLAPLRVGHRDLPAAFVHHSRCMHAHRGSALA